MTETTTRPLFKVLSENGMSCHGGSLQWSLPTKNEDGIWVPGGWSAVDGPLELCRNGLHLTSEPMNWYIEGSKIYAAEYEGDIVSDDPDKVAVRRARLTAETAWADHGVYHEGEHRLYGNASATLSGNASARLYGNASARLYDNASARLYDNASARLYDNASATLYDNASATLSGNASARLYGNASATLSGNASARLYGNASATLYGNASAISDQWHSPSAAVALEQLAAHIDRRGGTLVLRSATESPS